ncbi:type II secretion system protein GspN [Deferrisoma palaeochoriense]
MSGRKLALGAGYALLFLAAFVFFLWRSLPYRDIASALAGRLERHGIGVELSGVGPGGALGVRADRARITPPRAAVTLSFAEAQAWPDWARVIRGDPAVRFHARFAGGTVEGTFGAASPAFLELAWDGVALDRIPKPPPWHELPLGGTSRGRLEVDDLRARLVEATVSARADFSAVRLGPGKVRGVPVPEVALGDGKVDLRIAEGKADVREARFQGGEVEVLLNGASVLLRRPLGRSLVNGMLTLAPNEKAREDLALLFALFPGAPGSDGRYTARIRGSLQAPRLLRR